MLELCFQDFVDLLLPHVRSMEGGEEQMVAGLQLVHERIGQGVKGEEKEVKETTQARLASSGIHVTIHQKTMLIYYIIAI